MVFRIHFYFTLITLLHGGNATYPSLSTVILISNYDCRTKVVYRQMPRKCCVLCHCVLCVRCVNFSLAFIIIFSNFFFVLPFRWHSAFAEVPLKLESLDGGRPRCRPGRKPGGHRPRKSGAGRPANLCHSVTSETRLYLYGGRGRGGHVWYLPGAESIACRGVEVRRAHVTKHVKLCRRDEGRRVRRSNGRRNPSTRAPSHTLSRIRIT